MFDKRRRERIVEKLSMIKPTSKSELKRQCLYLSNLDVDKAEKMYNFLVKDVDIPDVEPSSKPFIQNFGEQANGVFGWFRENQDIIGQAIDFIKGVVTSRKGVVPPTNPLPPING